MIWQQGYNPLENMVVSTTLAAVPVVVMLVGLGRDPHRPRLLAAGRILPVFVI